MICVHIPEISYLFVSVQLCPKPFFVQRFSTEIKSVTDVQADCALDVVLQLLSDTCAAGDVYFLRDFENHNAEFEEVDSHFFCIESLQFFSRLIISFFNNFNLFKLRQFLCRLAVLLLFIRHNQVVRSVNSNGTSHSLLQCQIIQTT